MEETYRLFLDKVFQMRECQKLFFKMKKSTDRNGVLIKSKSLEKEVDALMNVLYEKLKG